MQIREIVAFARKPRFLLHDNDDIFGQYRTAQRRFPLSSGSLVIVDDGHQRTAHTVPGPKCESAGREISSHAAREDALNHFIFLNASHVRHVVREFIEYYNRCPPLPGNACDTRSRILCCSASQPASGQTHRAAGSWWRAARLSPRGLKRTTQ